MENPQIDLRMMVMAGNLEGVKKLINEGADVNEADLTGLTPLHVAAGQDRVEIAQILIDNGAKIEAEDAMGQTPLYMAVEFSNDRIVELLINAGAETDTYWDASCSINNKLSLIAQNHIWSCQKIMDLLARGRRPV